MSCRYLPRLRRRGIRDRHAEDCPDQHWHPPLSWQPCPGCEPCPEPHCGVCGREHVEQLTCPTCLGEARDHLSEIRRLELGVPLEAQELGDVESEAAMLAGPVANPEAYAQRRSYGYHEPEEVKTKTGAIVGEDHPLWILGTWDLLVTEHYDTRRTGRITVATSAAYLDLVLSDLAQDPAFPFPDLAHDLRRAREHLEDVLHDGERNDSGAPCMSCGAVLQKPTRKRRECTHPTPARTLLATLHTYPELPVWTTELQAAREACTTCDQGGRADYWECPRCKRRHTEGQYRFAVMNLHRDEAAWLTDRDMEIRTGVKAATVRSWGREGGPVRRRRDSGRTVYAVADVLGQQARRRSRHALGDHDADSA